MEVVASNKRIFSLREPGTGNYIRIDSCDLSCEQISVDDDKRPVIVPPRCDWALRVTSGEHAGKCTFVELKGSNLRHAMEQILNSIPQVMNLVGSFTLAKKSYIIATGSIPTTESQKLRKRFSKETNTNLIIQRKSTVNERFPV